MTSALISAEKTRHLIVSRELPPASYPAGGIGTYVANIAHVLADAGDIVHVVGQQWSGAPRATETRCEGRLIIHRVPMDIPVRYGNGSTSADELRILHASPMAAQAWGFNVAMYIEELVVDQRIDIIEAQEWEAPLYFFLLRRALGMGPTRQPPCVVHLHSPSESVWRQNDWSQSNPFLLHMRRQEEFCLAAADSLLSPSKYLKRDLAQRYGLDSDEITTIPYPLGEFREPSAGTDVTNERAKANTRADAPVLYVGRIEARKGLFEFVDAAVSVARQTPEIRFEFVGSDVHSPDGVSTQQLLQSRIPNPLRSRFSFTGGIPRDELWARYAAARFAVIPSRWENFPNTCIEAMALGVPVMASAEGGMAEVLVDGESGWIAASQDAVGLESALRRALFASADERARMGSAAREAIQRYCGNATVAKQHQAYRRDVIRRGAHRSLRLPVTLPVTTAPMHGPSTSAGLADSTRVAGNTTRMVQLAHAHDGHVSDYARRLAERFPDASVALVAPGYATDADALTRVQALLNDNPDIGVITGWVRGASHTQHRAPLCPAFPYQWLENEAWPIAIVRSSAITALREVPSGLTEPFATWYLINAVLEAGWKAVSAPFIVGVAVHDAAPTSWEFGGERHGEMHRRVRAAFSVALARDAQELVGLLDSRVGAAVSEPPAWVPGPDRWTGLTVGVAWRLPLVDKFALVGELMKNPWRVRAWLRSRDPRA